jgi:hypothetical protein
VIYQHIQGDWKTDHGPNRENPTDGNAVMRRRRRRAGSESRRLAGLKWADWSEGGLDRWGGVGAANSDPGIDNTVGNNPSSSRRRPQLTLQLAPPSTLVGGRSGSLGRGWFIDRRRSDKSVSICWVFPVRPVYIPPISSPPPTVVVTSGSSSTMDDDDMMSMNELRRHGRGAARGGEAKGGMRGGAAGACDGASRQGSVDHYIPPISSPPPTVVVTSGSSSTMDDDDMMSMNAVGFSRFGPWSVFQSPWMCW